MSRAYENERHNIIKKYFNNYQDLFDLSSKELAAKIEDFKADYPDLVGDPIPMKFSRSEFKKFIKLWHG